MNTLITTPECWQHIWMQLKYQQNCQLNAIAITIAIHLEYEVKWSWLQSCLTKNLPWFRSKMTNTLIATPECWQHIWCNWNSTKPSIKHNCNNWLQHLEYEVKWSWLQNCLTKNLPRFRSKMTNTLIATLSVDSTFECNWNINKTCQLNTIAITIAIHLEYEVKWSWLQSCLTKNLPRFRSKITNTLIATLSVDSTFECNWNINKTVN